MEYKEDDKKLIESANCRYYEFTEKIIEQIVNKNIDDVASEEWRILIQMLYPKNMIGSGLFQPILIFKISSKGLSEIQNISYYKARKYCKEIEAEGLIEHIREYIPPQFSYEGELEHDAFWNIGWRTTKKALENKIWKQEEAEEERIRKEVWG